MPSALAIFRLTTGSRAFGISTGRSVGLPTLRPAFFCDPFSHRIREARVRGRNRFQVPAQRLRAHCAPHFGEETEGAATAGVKAEGRLLGRGAICPVGVGNP